MYFDINKEAINLGGVTLPFWVISLIFLIIIIIFSIKALKNVIKKIWDWIKIFFKWIGRGFKKIFLSLSNQEVRSNIKEGWKKWSDFYGFKINFNGTTLLQMTAFAFIILFINILVFFSSIIIKEVVKVTFSQLYATLIIVLFSLIFMYVLVSFYLINGIEKEYSPYFFSFLIITVTLLPTISAWTKGISIGLIVFILLPGFYYSWEKPKWKILITLVVMATIFLLGLVSIYALYSEKQDTIHFRDCDTQQIIPNVNMSCSSSIIDGQINGQISNFLTKCQISPEIMNFSGNLTYQYINGSDQTIPILKNEISFLPPDKIKGVRYLIYSNNNTNWSSCMDITWPVYFKSYEEYKQDKERFIAYLFALLGLVFITIPPMVIKFIEIWKDN